MENLTNSKRPEEAKSKAWIIRYVVAYAILIASVFAILSIRDIYSKTDPKTIFLILTDAFTVPGFIFVLFGLLVWLSNNGAFSMLAYGIRTLFSALKRDPTDRKYRSYYDYKVAREGVKTNFMFLIISGFSFLAVGIVFMIIYYSI